MAQPYLVDWFLKSGSSDWIRVSTSVSGDEIEDVFSWGGAPPAPGPIDELDVLEALAREAIGAKDDGVQFTTSGGHTIKVRPVPGTRLRSRHETRQYLLDRARRGMVFRYGANYVLRYAVSKEVMIPRLLQDLGVIGWEIVDAVDWTQWGGNFHQHKQRRIRCDLEIWPGKDLDEDPLWGIDLPNYEKAGKRPLCNA